MTLVSRSVSVSATPERVIPWLTGTVELQGRAEGGEGEPGRGSTGSVTKVVGQVVQDWKQLPWLRRSCLQLRSHQWTWLSLSCENQEDGGGTCCNISLNPS